MSGRWRYSLRWGNPHTRPTCDLVLAAAEVAAGAPCPPEVSARWVPGGGYAVCVDVLDPRPIRRWSQEAKGAAYFAGET